MQKAFNQYFTVSSVHNIVDLLAEKYKKEELEVSTGTEEETTERGTLLKDIIAIQENGKAALNTVLNAESTDTAIEADDYFVEADKERADYVDEAFGPNGKRRGCARLSLEDEMLANKQNHDFLLDKEKTERDLFGQNAKLLTSMPYPQYSSSIRPVFFTNISSESTDDDMTLLEEYYTDMESHSDVEMIDAETSDKDFVPYSRGAQ